MPDKQQPPEDAVRYRSMTLEFEPGAAPAIRADGEQDTRIPVAISSESRVERYDWWTDERYYEVLDHEPASVDLDYARDGLPFLLDHDTRVQVGILEEVRVDADRKVRGLLRMGNHPDAAWVEKDIRQGVRKKVSVGYRLGEYRIEKEEFEGLPVRRYRWRPMEGSSVPIPADYDVGVGRSADLGAKDLASLVERHKDKIVALIQPGAPDLKDDAPAVDQRAVQDEPAPKAKELAMSDELNTDGAAPAHKAGPSAVTLEDQRNAIAAIYDLTAGAGFELSVARDMVGRGLSLVQAKAELFERKVAEAAKPTPVGHLDLSHKEARQFNLCKAVLAIADQRWGRYEGIEKEVHNEIAKKLNRESSNLLIPLDLPVFTRASVTGNIAGTSSLGGAGVQTTVLSLIELLRNRMKVRELGARVMTGLTGNITFPRQITANSITWTGENPSTAVALTAATVDNVAMSPKTAMVGSAYSRQFLAQSSFDAQAFVQDDLSMVGALGLDLAAINGAGSANEPTGIFSTSNVNTVDLATDGGFPTWAQLVSFETKVATANADIGTMAWLTTPGVRGQAKTTLKSTTAGSAYLWSDDNTVAGYRAEVSNQVPTNFTRGTSTTVCHGAILGVWSELLVGEWNGVMELIVDPYTKADQNMIRLIQSFAVDIAVRHPKAFAYTKHIVVT